MNFKEYEAERLRSGSSDFAEKSRKALQICDPLLGEGLYTESRIRQICENENHYFYIIRQSENIVGVVYCYADRFDRTEYFGKLQIPGVLPDTRIGVGKSIALLKEVRLKGVSEWMTEHCTEILLEKERAEAVLMTAWMKGDKIPAHRSLENCSYRLLQILKQPWAACETLKCHVCNTIPCSCDGAVYIRRRKDNEQRNETP